MESFFTPDFFKGNRTRLRELFAGTAPIVICANGQMQRSGDTAYPFTQDSNFWYLTGINDADIILVIDKDSEYLIKPDLNAVQAAFEGEINGEDLSKRSGVDTILDSKEGWKKLNSRVKRVKHVASIAPLPPYLDLYRFYTNPARADLLEKLHQVNADFETLDLRPALALLRMVKQPAEVRAIERAIDLTIDSLKETMKASKKNKYTTENEIEATLTYNYRVRAASGHGFPPIVAGGKRACTIHNFDNTGAINRGELLLIDTGAEVEHYSADLTRTYAFNKPTKRQIEVQRAVVESLEYAFSILKPGVVVRQYERTMEHFVGEKLRELGLIKVIESEAVRKYFPHATSHYLGLDTHDAGDYDRAIEPGVVLAVEPGIYIPEESLGVRIEDNVLITKRTAEIMVR